MPRFINNTNPEALPSNAVTLDGVQTLTNKTINASNNTIIMSSSQLSDGASLVTLTGTQVLQNKTINGTQNTVSAYYGEFTPTLTSIPDSSLTVLPLTVNRDPTGMWSAGNPTRATPQRTGRYLLRGTLTFSGGSGGNGIITRLRVNGSEIDAASSSEFFQTGTYGGVCTNETTYFLNANDYVEITATQYSGGPIDIGGSGLPCSSLFLEWLSAS